MTDADYRQSQADRIRRLADHCTAQRNAIAGLKDDLECARADADRHRRFAEAESARALSLQARLEFLRRMLAAAAGPGPCMCGLCHQGPVSIIVEESP